MKPGNQIDDLGANSCRRQIAVLRDKRMSAYVYHAPLLI